MPIENVPLLQPLENRRLLSLTPIGSEVTVPMPTEMSQFDMAVGGDGSFIVVADPIEQPGSPDLIAVRYDANGQQIGAPLTLDDRGFNVSVSMDADGDAVVAYQKGSTGVYVVHVSKAGAAAAPQRVGTAPTNQIIYEADVSMDRSGGYFVAWLQRPTDTLGGIVRENLQFRSFDAAGAPRGEQFDTGGDSDLGSWDSLDLAAHPDGSGAVVAFNTYNEGFSHIAVDRVGPTAWSEGFEGPSGTGRAFHADVAVHADGSFVIGYEGVTVVSESQHLIHYSGFAQRYDTAGVKVGSEIALGASLPGSGGDHRIYSVTVDTMPNGGFLAGFQQGSDVRATTYARRFNSDGVSTDGPTPIDGFHTPRGHVIGTDDQGDAVLAYLEGPFEEGPFETEGSGPVHVRRISTAFAELRGSELFVDGTEGNDHIIIERVRERLWVNVNGIVEGYNAANVQFLSISGLGGDDDIINASAIPSTISGGDGADTLWGGVGSDSLRGFGGDDVLRGGDSHDTLRGDSGSDALYGGDDNDELSGDDGLDILLGSSGNDFLRGGRGSDSLYGEAGNDVLHGGASDDYLEAGAGHDELYGEGGHDALLGLAGNDRLFADDDDGAAAADTVRGGAGVDSAKVDEEDDVLEVENIR